MANLSRHTFPILLGVALLLAAPSAIAGSADLTPCRGDWTGIGRDPWLPDEPYSVELHITGGQQQCASVRYGTDGSLCTARWEDCKVSGEWVFANEVLVDPGECAPGRVTLRCVNPDTVEVKWEGEPGVVETTLRRVSTAPAAVVVQTAAPEPALVVRESPPAEGGGCGCSLAWLVVPAWGWRRRRFGNW